MNLVVLNFAFIGKIIKAIEFFVQDSLDKHHFKCKRPMDLLAILKKNLNRTML